MNTIFRYTAISFAALVCAFSLSAQTIEQQLEKAAEMHRSYDFDGALEIYENLLPQADSTLRSTLLPLILQNENGLNMLNFATSPRVLDVKKVAAADFFLWYGHLADGRWVPAAEPHPVYRAVYVPDKCSTLYFSAPDGKGSWSIRTAQRLNETLWSAPQPAGEALSSERDDIFPILSEDGTRLFFASNGLAGMGGYDLFVSTLSADGKTWGAPENLGFPFSSPGNDFLYCDTPDGRYSIFASDRDCEKGFIKIYLLAFDNRPVRRSLNDLSEIRQIASLAPPRAEASQESSATSSATAADRRFEAYFKAVGKLAALNEALAAGGDDALLMDLHTKIGEARSEIGALEMEMLSEGIVPPSIDTRKEGGTPAAAHQTVDYPFRKGTLAAGALSFEEPEADEMAFGTGGETQIFANYKLPEGLCWQIQLCAVSGKLQKKRFHGITPVFEERQKSGKYIYYAGLFDNAMEARDALAAVRKNGFSTAFIVTWKDGKKVK